MDERQRKTRKLLADAILRLASEGPVSALGMSDVAATAGVNRSTVYQHAASPIGLLRDVLSEQLDGIRDEFLPGASASDAAAAVDGVTRAVLAHVNEHAAVYSHGLGEQSEAASLHTMLSSHFESSVRLLLDQRSIAVPREVESELLRATVARFVAQGTVGAIEVWLGTPEPRSTDEFMRVYGQVLPSWWPRPLDA